jgi:hypothetical protein
MIPPAAIDTPSGDGAGGNGSEIFCMAITPNKDSLYSGVGFVKYNIPESLVLRAEIA